MHSQGKGAKFCRANPPLALVYLENNLSQSQALKREYQIKQLTRRQKLALCDRRQKLTGEASMSEVDCWVAAGLGFDLLWFKESLLS